MKTNGDTCAIERRRRELLFGELSVVDKLPGGKRWDGTCDLPVHFRVAKAVDRLGVAR